jgi:hypothetical protein
MLLYLQEHCGRAWQEVPSHRPGRCVPCTRCFLSPLLSCDSTKLPVPIRHLLVCTVLRPTRVSRAVRLPWVTNLCQVCQTRRRFEGTAEHTLGHFRDASSRYELCEKRAPLQPCVVSRTHVRYFVCSIHMLFLARMCFTSFASQWAQGAPWAWHTLLLTSCGVLPHQCDHFFVLICRLFVVWAPTTL